MLLPRTFAGPATISRVTFVNPTSYALGIEVTGAREDGWTDLATAERERTTEVRDVVDPGKTWIFRFESQGVDGGELRLSKDELARAGWKVEIPASVGDRLAEKGAPPTPPPGF